MRRVQEVNSIKVIWSVAPKVTGLARVCEKRPWPSSKYEDGSPFARIECVHAYSLSLLRNSIDLELKVCVAKYTGNSFEWATLKTRVTGIIAAQVLAKRYFEVNPQYMKGTLRHE